MNTPDEIEQPNVNGRIRLVSALLLIALGPAACSDVLAEKVVDVQTVNQSAVRILGAIGSLTAVDALVSYVPQRDCVADRDSEAFTNFDQNAAFGLRAFLAPVQQDKNCCAVNPSTLTACTQSLFQSFKNLTAGVGVSNCHPSLNFPTVSFAMPENCFSHQTTSPSMVTYSTFYVSESEKWPGLSPEFRVIWGAAAGNFAYYGVCVPNPIIFPHPDITENHVFAAKLIKQTDYKAFSGSKKDWNTMASVPAIPVSDIQQITGVYLEERGGHISTTEAADYNNPLSSKGIVVNVKLKTGKSVPCYVINNYDGAGTVYWKESNPACAK
jgi:hypothetical protein